MNTEHIIRILTTQLNDLLCHCAQENPASPWVLRSLHRLILVLERSSQTVRWIKDIYPVTFIDNMLQITGKNITTKLLRSVDSHRAINQQLITPCVLFKSCAECWMASRRWVFIVSISSHWICILFYEFLFRGLDITRSGKSASTSLVYMLLYLSAGVNVSLGISLHSEFLQWIKDTRRYRWLVQNIRCQRFKNDWLRTLALVCGAVEASGHDALSFLYPGRNPMILSLLSTFSVSFETRLCHWLTLFFFSLCALFFFLEPDQHYYYKDNITSLRLATNREQERMGTSERHVVPTG